jgi:chemotaxis protein CheX
MLMSPPWIRAFVHLSRLLKQMNMQLRMVCVEASLEAHFRSEGVDGLLRCSSTLRHALQELGLASPSKSIDTEFVNPFLGATLGVLKLQASTNAVAGKPFMKSEASYLGDVSGVIGLVSESFSGNVVISFPKQTFLNIMSKMLGETYPDLTPELTDGAAELLNIIFGQAKIALNAKGYGIKTALPSVVSGKDHAVHTKTGGTSVVVPFESDSGNFFVEICTSG